MQENSPSIIDTQQYFHIYFILTQEVFMEALANKMYQVLIVSDGSALICQPPAREALRDALRALDITVETELYNKTENTYLFLVAKQDTDKLPIATENALRSLQTITQRNLKQMRRPVAVATNMSATDVEYFRREAERLHIQYSLERTTSTQYTIYVENEQSLPGRTSSYDKAKMALAKAALAFAGTTGRFVQDDLATKNKQEEIIVAQLEQGVTNPFFIKSSDRILAISAEGCQVICNNNPETYIDASEANYKNQVMGLVQDMPPYSLITADGTINRNALGTMVISQALREKLETERLLRQSVELKLGLDNGRQGRFSSNIYDGHLSFAEFFKIECLNDRFEEIHGVVVYRKMQDALKQPDSPVNEMLNSAQAYMQEHTPSREREQIVQEQGGE